jgi:Phage tail assembly chaperone proteins, E, or 41 or 14
MNETIKVDLTQPITAHGNETWELSLRIPTFGDLIAIDEVKGGELSKMARLIERLGAINKKAVEELSLTDVQAISEALKPFLASQITT